METKTPIEPVGKTGKGTLSAKVRAALDDFVRRPWVTITQIAADNGVDKENLCSVIKVNRPYIRQESDRLYSEAREMAQQRMVELAQKGNYKALEFVLKTNGVIPTERTLVESNDINITIGKEDAEN